MLFEGVVYETFRVAVRYAVEADNATDAGRMLLDGESLNRVELSEPELIGRWMDQKPKRKGR